MRPYDEALKEILEQGTPRTNKRTGIKTISIFGMCKRYRLDTEYFPICSRRKVWPKSVFSELIWFLSGKSDNESLKALGCNFWTPWVDEDFEKKHGFAPGSFGPVYGFQLRYFGGAYGNGKGGKAFTDNDYILDHSGPSPKTLNYYGYGGYDQLSFVVNKIKEDHSDRRTLWTLWNPKDVASMRLPPCHMLYQVLVDDERRLTGIMYQRSCDFPVGGPANIQFYSALTVMLAQQTDCTPHEFVHMTADSHIYENQINAVEQYLDLPEVPSPKLEICKAKDIFSYNVDDFVLKDYNPGPKIDIPVAV
jgi:thymidylate synthase